MTKELSRRSFLAGAALVGTGVATGLVGCSPKQSGGSGSEGDVSQAATTFFDAPEPIAEDAISATIDTEVVVVGLGVAGISALRSATEAGLKTVGIEKCATQSIRSSQFSVFNTETARTMGIENIETTELVNEIMTQTGHRSDFKILKTWADNCGEAFDWYTSAYDGLVWQKPGEKPPADEKQVYIANSNIYEPYKYGRDHEMIFTGTLSVRPDGHEPVALANLDKTLASGNTEVYYDSPVRQLIMEEGRITGVVFQNLNDESYTKVNASKAVVLATGGYGHNDEMLEHYLYWFYDNKDQFTFTYTHVDANGEFADQGDGHQMAMWIGAKMEDGPHCAMAHGDLGALGVDAFLQLNSLGERYINEDLTNDHFGSNFIRQPKSSIYQIFDSKWAEQLSAMQAGLGTAHDAESIMARRGHIEEWVSAQGNTVEELIANLEVDDAVANTMLQEIERYNELCSKGVDEDFGKTAERMFPVESGPFYAIKYSTDASESSEMRDSLRLLVTMSGLATNTKGQVYSTEWDIIPGLYAIGNVQGNRFGGDYPTTIAGASHSIAMTYGYLVGKHLAEV